MEGEPGHASVLFTGDNLGQGRVRSCLGLSQFRPSYQGAWKRPHGGVRRAQSAGAIQV